MEILIFALIASYNAYRQKEPVVAEPEEFQPFDLEAIDSSPLVRYSTLERSGTFTAGFPPAGTAWRWGAVADLSLRG